VVRSSTNNQSRNPVSWLATPVSLESKDIPEVIRNRLFSFFQECPQSDTKVVVAPPKDLEQKEDTESVDEEEAPLEGEEDLEDLSSCDEADEECLEEDPELLDEEMPAKPN
jgi:hypothetical protein